MDTPPTPATQLAGHAWAAGEQRHIVDQLIDERATSLSKNPLWPILRPLLLSTFHYRKAVRMADDIAGLSGYDAFRYLSRLLSLDLMQRGVEKLPKTGAFILAPSLTRIIRSLEERGLITKHKDADDGRRVLLEIAPEGMRVIADVSPESRAIYEELEARYGHERVEVLLDMLDELASLND